MLFIPNNAFNYGLDIAPYSISQMSLSKLATTPGCEYRMNADGSKNPQYVDLLDEDPAIAGQKFTCMSFISPEEIIKQKEIYYFQKFLKTWDMNKSLEKYSQFMNFISYKHGIDIEVLNKDLTEFVEAEEPTVRSNASIADDYKSYIEKHGDRMTEEFGKDHEFSTSVRGIKIRGVFSTQEEAEMKCKQLRELDTNHDVYVGSVGMWMPFHPEAYRTGRVEYLEDELNQLMSEKKKNEAVAKTEFEKRIRDAKVAAIEDNKTKAEASGNLLTQIADKDGNLTNVRNITEEEAAERTVAPAVDTAKKSFSSAEVATDLFEKPNVGTVATNDGANYSVD